MKFSRLKASIAILAIIAMAAVILGCTTTSQTTAYNTISTVEQTAGAAVDGYYTAVLKGLLPTNGVPVVSKSFNELQIACTLAATSAQAGTNQLASATLTAELADVLALVAQFESTTNK